MHHVDDASWHASARKGKHTEQVPCALLGMTAGDGQPTCLARLMCRIGGRRHDMLHCLLDASSPLSFLTGEEGRGLHVEAGGGHAGGSGCPERAREDSQWRRRHAGAARGESDTWRVTCSACGGTCCALTSAAGPSSSQGMSGIKQTLDSVTSGRSAAPSRVLPCVRACKPRLG